MKVREVMTQDVSLISPSDTIGEAAKTMYKLDAGCLPVVENDRLVGIITDRDIAVRAIAAGRGPDTPVGSVMSNGVCYCFEDQDLGDIAANMADIQVRRLPVMNRDKKLVGILSVGDIATSHEVGGVALSGIVVPSSQHNQSDVRDPYHTL
jgi:CBS domain-containing protein